MSLRILAISVIYFLVMQTQIYGASYQDLSYTPADQADVQDLLETLSSRSTLGLLGERSRLNALGKRIDHVHPLKFLEIIFTDNHLKSCLREVDSSFFKRTAFMKGLGKSFKAKAKLGEVEPYIQDFSKAVKIPIESLQPYFRDEDWIGLVNKLLSIQAVFS